MITEIIVIIAIIGLLMLAARKPLLKYFEALSKSIVEESLKLAEQKSREVVREESRQMLEQYNLQKEVMDEKIKKEQQFVENKKDSIKELVDKISETLNKSQKKIEETEKDRISEFSKLATILDEHKIVTGDLKRATDNLKNVLSNNQLRGKYGEEVAENLLKSVGFVRGQNYDANIQQDMSEKRPDFTIYLPDKTKINIDAKFPLQALVKYQEAADKSDQDRFFREFASDVKEKIKQVTTRNYIDPEENTVDFVVLFVPNEMIFSFIYDRLNDVWNDAMKKKVVLAGPFSFTAILRMVFQTYKNFTYQQDIYNIIKLVKTFEQEYAKFNKELDTLGARLESTQTQYHNVSVTRTKKLSSIVEKITGEEALPEPSGQAKLLE